MGFKYKWSTSCVMIWIRHAFSSRVIYKQLNFLQAVTDDALHSSFTVSNSPSCKQWQVDVLHSSGEIWVHDLRSIPWCDVGKSKTEPRFNMRRRCTKSTQLLWWALLRVLRGRAVVPYNHSWRWGTTRARTFHKHSTELLSCVASCTRAAADGLKHSWIRVLLHWYSKPALDWCSKHLIEKPVLTSIQNSIANWRSSAEGKRCVCERGEGSRCSCSRKNLSTASIDW